MTSEVKTLHKVSGSDIMPEKGQREAPRANRKFSSLVTKQMDLQRVLKSEIASGRLISPIGSPITVGSGDSRKVLLPMKSQKGFAGNNVNEPADVKGADSNSGTRVLPGPGSCNEEKGEKGDDPAQSTLQPQVASETNGNGSRKLMERTPSTRVRGSDGSDIKYATMADESNNLMTVKHVAGKWKTHKKKRYDYMLHPQSSKRLLWDAVSLILVGVVIAMVPYQLAFVRQDVSLEDSGAPEIINYFIDVFFICDVLLNFRSGFIDEAGVVELRSSPVFNNYVYGWFLIDLCSSIPWDWFGGGGGGAQMMRVLKVGKLTKIFKVFRVSKIFKEGSPMADRLEELTVSSQAQNTIALSTMTGWLLLVTHILACGWGYVGHVAEHTWMDTYSDGLDDSASEYFADKTMRMEPAMREYLVCLYWALMTLTSVGYGDICPESDLGRLYAIFAMIIGGAFYGA